MVTRRCGGDAPSRGCSSSDTPEWLWVLLFLPGHGRAGRGERGVELWAQSTGSAVPPAATAGEGWLTRRKSAVLEFLRLGRWQWPACSGRTSYSVCLPYLIGGRSALAVHVWLFAKRHHTAPAGERNSETQDSSHVYWIDGPLHKPDSWRSLRACAKSPPLPSQLSRIGVHAALRATIAAKQAAEFAKNAPARADATLGPAWTPWFRTCSTAHRQRLIRRAMTRGKCWSSGKASSAGRRTRGGLVTIRKSSETLGFSRERHKRQAETSESSGKSWLTGSQESPHPVVRQPGRAGGERRGTRVEFRRAPPGRRSRAWETREDLTGMTGRPPFTDLSPIETVKRILGRDDPRSIDGLFAASGSSGRRGENTSFGRGRFRTADQPRVGQMLLQGTRSGRVGWEAWALSATSRRRLRSGSSGLSSRSLPRWNAAAKYCFSFSARAAWCPW